MAANGVTTLMLAAVTSLVSVGCGREDGISACGALGIDALAVDPAGDIYVVGFPEGNVLPRALESKRLSARAGHDYTASLPAFRSAYVLETDLGGNVGWLRTLDTGDGSHSNVTAGAATLGSDVVVFGSGAAATRIDATGATVATFGTFSVVLTDKFVVGSHAPLGTVTADGSIVVAIDERSTLARFDPTGAPVWTLSVSPQPSRLVPDLTGGVWYMTFQHIVHLGPAGDAVAAAARSAPASPGFTGAAVRDVSGTELLVVPSSDGGVTAVDLSGRLAWTRPDVKANGVVTDGRGTLIAVDWTSSSGFVRVTWLDAAGDPVASAAYEEPNLMTSAGSVKAVAGAPGGAVIAVQAGASAMPSGSGGSTATAGSCDAQQPHLLIARTADHSLAALDIAGLTGPESP